MKALVVTIKTLFYTTETQTLHCSAKPGGAMTEKNQKETTTKKTCDGCGGSGQISFFRGVSRFVMDWDDCPDCSGTGYVEASASPEKDGEREQDRMKD